MVSDEREREREREREIVLFAMKLKTSLEDLFKLGLC